jgi:hypothetical protein
MENVRVDLISMLLEVNALNVVLLAILMELQQIKIVVTV